MTKQEDQQHNSQQLQSMERYRGVPEFDGYIKWLEEKLQEETK